MATLPHTFVGVDVSAKTLDIALYPQGKHWTISNDLQGIESLVQRLGEMRVQSVVMEATGGFERVLVNGLREHGYLVHVVNPRRIANWRQVMAKNAKTDRIDALLIAEFAATMTLDKPFMPTPLQQQLRDLAARREQLVRQAAIAKKQRRQAHLPAITQSIERQLSFCQAEITAIESAMTAIFEHDIDLAKQRDLLVSIPGVGSLSAMLILSELPEITHISAKQLASLVGVVPHPQHSGKQTGKARLTGGRPRIRAKCYILAHNAIRYNDWLKAYADGLAKRGKSRREIIIAAINKLLHLAHAILKRGTPWQNQPLQHA